MELIRRHLADQPSGYAAYLSLQRALMRRHIARGGSAEDFCRRLSPHFRARYGAVTELAGTAANAESGGRLERQKRFEAGSETELRHAA